MVVAVLIPQGHLQLKRASVAAAPTVQRPSLVTQRTSTLLDWAAVRNFSGCSCESRNLSAVPTSMRIGD